MPIITGDGTTGTEFKSDRVKYPTGTSDPSSPSTGDLYFNTCLLYTSDAADE